jgi:hypothetical protein
MPTPSRIETAIEISPLTVLVRGVRAWACPHAFLEDLFDRECRPRQWNRKLSISAIAWLMLAVVSGVRRSVFAAFQADRRSDRPTIVATAAALYAKYGRIDPRYTAAVVRRSGRRSRGLLDSAGVKAPFGWEGYRVTILDGTDLGGTEHRLEVLRRTEAAGLPGRFVVAYDLATGVVDDAVAGEDAYTSERELVRSILAAAEPGQCKRSRPEMDDVSVQDSPARPGNHGENVAHTELIIFALMETCCHSGAFGLLGVQYAGSLRRRKSLVSGQQ